MKNLKLNSKLLLCFSIVLIMLLISTGAGILSMKIMKQQIDQYSTRTLPNTQAVWGIRRNLVSAERNLLDAILEQDPRREQKKIEKIESDVDSIRTLLNSLNSNTHIDKEILDDFSMELDQIHSVRQEICNVIKQGDDAKGYEIYKEQYIPKYKTAVATLLKVSEYEKQLSEEQNNKAYDALRTGQVILFATFLFAVLVTLLLIAVLKKSILTPIQEINLAAQSVAEGNLNTAILYESKDELGELSDAMRSLVSHIVFIIRDLDYKLSELGKGNFTIEIHNDQLYIGDFMNLQTSMHQIVEKLTKILSQINAASDQVTIGADQVSNASQLLSEGATEQASSIEEVAASMTEISEQVRRNAESALDGKVYADEAEALVLHSNDIMNQMVEAMNEINNTSDEIGKILMSIDEIAFQTNILALNAAVEAARAGEAGKGFAVVANEVRNLAGKSAESAKNTEILIKRSIQAVENGVTIVNKTAQSLGKIVEKTSNVSTIIDKITISSEEQANSVIQVTKAIDQISSVVQTNSATAEESAAASEELNQQAHLLRNLVNVFQLKENGLQ